jgi:hypothetical protein
MVIDFKFNIGDKIYFVGLYKMAYTYAVEEGNIFGFQVIQGKNHNLDIRVNTRQYNGIPMEWVFLTKEDADKKCVELNERGCIID